MTRNQILKAALYLSGGCTVARLARRRRFCGCRAFNFHRLLPVESASDDYARIMDEPDVVQLERLLRYLRRWFKFITPEELVRATKRGRVEPYSLILTFDDGYVDMHDRLLPLLERLELPATIFVNTAALSGEVLWFQRLFAAVVRTPLDRLPGVIGVQSMPLITVRDRVKAITLLSRRQPHYSAEEWPRAIEEVCDSLAWDGDLGDERMMNWEQLARLSKSPWITIGGHTVSHPYLTRCTPDRLRDELVDCADELRSRLGLRFLPFAYPFGGYLPSIAEAVQKYGYDCAFIMDPGLNTAHTPRYQLFRHCMRADTVGAAFDISFRVPLSSSVRIA